MFNFFKKEKPGVTIDAFLKLSTDIHSHVLPGIDDGSPDIDTSLELVKGMIGLGFKKLVATPHVIGDLYRNTPETIGKALEKLQKACLSEGIHIELSAAAEYMLDDYFLQLLKNNSKILPVYNNIILTELPYSVKPMNVEEMVFSIITAGYKPILAHPERYFYYHNNYEEYFQLKELGFLLQVNLLSLTGYYGVHPAKAAKFIFDNDLADFTGTDLHHKRHLEMLGNGNNINLLNKTLEKKQYNSLGIL